MSPTKDEYPEGGIWRSGARDVKADPREQSDSRPVFISAKPDNFIAGADINMIARAQSAQEAEDLARQGQQVMAEIHSLPIPAIAAIHGACRAVGWSWRWPVTVVFVLTTRKPFLGCRKYSLGCFRLRWNAASAAAGWR